MTGQIRRSRTRPCHSRRRNPHPRHQAHVSPRQPVPAEAMVEAAGEHVREALAVYRCDERPTFEELPRSR